MDRKTDLRLWAVLFWLAAWQIAAMALAAVYPHGELLLASPADVLLGWGSWPLPPPSGGRWPGPPSGSSADFCSPRCWRSHWRHWRRGNSGSGG